MLSRRRWVVAVALVASLAVAGCSSGDSGGSAQLSWYINPDNGGQKRLAEKCSAQSNGAFTITTQLLPNDADAQREQLVRRLAAGDSSVDLMSLDPPFVAEFANANYLSPITRKSDVEQLTAGVLAAPLKGAYWKGKLVATPFWANTQLLWFRKSVAAAAGVDPTSPDFTWDQMIHAAVKEKKKVAVQGRRYEGYMVWINALVASAGGQIIEHTNRGDKATPSLASKAGDDAARVIRRLATSEAAPPDLSTSSEEEARSLFQSSAGAFMVNWPYVYGAAKAAVDTKSLDQSVVDDIGWARYPEVVAGKQSRPPLGGINLAIGKFSTHQAEALAAVKCITSAKNNAAYMVDSGNPAARSVAYDDAKVRKAFPMASLIRDSINSAGPRPITPFYGDVSTSVQNNWHPAASIDPKKTPKETDTFMTQVLRGDRLL